MKKYIIIALMAIFAISLSSCSADSYIKKLEKACGDNDVEKIEKYIEKIGDKTHNGKDLTDAQVLQIGNAFDKMDEDKISDEDALKLLSALASALKDNAQFAAGFQEGLQEGMNYGW